MKRKLILSILLILCILLCACGEKASVSYSETATRDSETTAAVTDAPTEAPAAPTEAETPAEGQVRFVTIDGDSVHFDLSGQQQNYTVANGYVRGITYKELLNLQSPVVIKDEIAYVADSLGVRAVRQDGSLTYLTHTPARSIATDGETLLFTAETDEDTAENNGVSYWPAEIRSVGCDGKDEKKLCDCTIHAAPIMLYNDTLYYFDESIEQYAVRGLMTAELPSGTSQMQVQGVTFPYVYGTKFIYADHATQFNIYCSLSAYDYASGQQEVIADVTGDVVDCDGNTVYSSYDEAEEHGSENSGDLLAYQPDTGALSIAAYATSGIPLTLQAAFDGQLFCYGRDDSSGYHYYQIDAQSGTQQEIDYEFVIKTTNCAIFIGSDGYYGWVDNAFVKLPIPSEGGSLVEYYGDLYFYRDYDQDSDEILIAHLY